MDDEKSEGVCNDMPTVAKKKDEERKLDMTKLRERAVPLNADKQGRLLLDRNNPELREWMEE